MCLNSCALAGVSKPVTMSVLHAQFSLYDMYSKNETRLKYAPVLDEFPEFLYGQFHPPIDLLQGQRWDWTGQGKHVRRSKSHEISRSSLPTNPPGESPVSTTSRACGACTLPSVRNVTHHRSQRHPQVRSGDTSSSSRDFLSLQGSHFANGFVLR